MKHGLKNGKRSRVNPFGLAFSQMTVSDLLLVSPEGNIVSGGKPNRQVYNEVGGVYNPTMSNHAFFEDAHINSV